MNQAEKIIQLDGVKPKRSRETKKRGLLSLLFVSLLVSAVVGWFWLRGGENLLQVKGISVSPVRQGEFVSTTEASGTVILPTQVEIVSPQDGYTASLLVEEGVNVKPGDILAELEVPDLEDSLNQLNVSLEQARIELESLENSWYYQIEQIKRELTRLNRDIEDAEIDAETYRELAVLKSSRQSDYDDALDTLTSLNEEKEDLNADLEEAEISRDIALRKQQAAIRQLQVDLEIAEKDLEETRIKSPIAGEVLSINDDLFITGSLIEQAASLFVVADREDVYIDFDVYEQYVSLLEPGDEMTVTIGTSTMKARIIKIGKIATMDTDGLAAMVTVRAKPLGEQTLTPGASAAATITLSVQENVLLLPRGAWLTTGGQEYAYVLSGNRAVKKKVTLGDIQGTSVEILSGLSEGDRVITSSYQSFIDQDEILVKNN